MSLMENVSDVYEQEDAQRVEAIASTLMQQFYDRVLTQEAGERTTLRALARRGEPRAARCVQAAAVIVNFMREELT
ncbi:MAG: hypothetical protein KJ890_15570 [Gammaproteobacteria bacterium]|uniref:hypothetical protein n=1 Tax=Stutzerimonas stutzeri TaxID=316 RepID=UPI000838BDE4|nr:hypothetical protein [Stutzerimonas stutzeri]MBU0564908.1 hypothetical protein [Gammaproteobacteria bacterium]MBU1803848.1 hypothetical protein [Gammaproteobacteria bacterium]MDH1555941.1 hypothetical protein [Stutzerimonas stutzeri]OCX57171.1 hypothetical protein BFM99_13965 [Stutzerimonas stutzeri]